jgi:hypothetical protein
MFENFIGTGHASGHFPLRRTSWEDHQATAASDEDVGQHQMYPPTYPEGQFHGQHLFPPNASTDLVGPGCYPSPHPTSYSPSPHVPTEEVQPTHVVAPTPVNLIIQTNFTRVEHNYHYASQESDTPSGYESTPPPTTASSTRSSFSFTSADSPTSPFGQVQEHAVNYDPQHYTGPRNVYLPYQLHHQYDVVDGRYYHPLPEQGASPCRGYPDGGGICYPPASDYGSPDRNCGYESEPEPDRGWVTYQTPAYQFYATQNQATEVWRRPTWFHPAVTKSNDGVRDGAYDNRTNCFGSVGNPTNCDSQSR